MLESIANAIPVEGMESLMPALVDHLEPVGSMLPKHAVILLGDLRNCAVPPKTWQNRERVPGRQLACGRLGHGAGAPISFDEASFLDYAETISPSNTPNIR